MSTLKLENIQHPDSSTPAISLHSSGGMSGSFPYPNRNLIYNGAMQVHQRGTSATSITSSGYYTADRWRMEYGGSLGTWTQSVESEGPAGSGLTKSMKILCTAATTSPASNGVTSIAYRIEGQDLQRVAKGTSSALQLTLSFWVKSNVTGTYVVNLRDIDNLRLHGISYTIDSVDTWEYKTLTFDADTVGTFDNDNARSLDILLWLAAGSNYTTGSLSTWAAEADANRAVGQTNLAASVNNYWQITGVQLETGSIATEFEHESYGTTLAKCQRYFYRILSLPNGGQVVGSTPYGYSSAIVKFGKSPVTMRTGLGTLVVSNTSSGAFRYYGASGWTNVATVLPTNQNGELVCQMSTDSPSSAGLVRVFDNNSGSTITFDANAEL